MILSLNYIRKKMGWCPNTAMMQTAAVLPSENAENFHRQQPGGDDGGRRIARGAGIAARSIKTLIHNRKLLWYPLLAGLALLLVYLTEMAFKAYAIMTCSGSYTYWSLGSFQGFFLTFVVEFIAILFLNFLFAAIILDISKNPEKTGAVREGFSLAKKHLKVIAGWSVILAIIATVVYVIVHNQPWNAHFYPALGTTMFEIPFVYYVPILPLATITAVIEKMLYAVPVFILTLYVIPLLVLENRSLPGAISGLAGFLRRTWVEIIACFSIFGLILVGISLISPFICMTPVFVDYDYHFFAVYAIPMAVICILFLAGLWTAVASLFTTAGIAARDLYNIGKTERTQDKQF